MKILYETKPQKIRVTIEDGIDPATALEHVAEVVSRGRVSKNGTMYCFATVFPDETRVIAVEYRKNDCFLVEKFKYRTNI
jgi:hypothetical protein